MTLPFAIICAITLVSAVAAMTLRNLIHCALSVAVTFAGLALLYLQLEAQFAGFAQILVYLGAVAILIVFAVLLTRGAEPAGSPVRSSQWWVGVAAAFLLFAVLAGALLTSQAFGHGISEPAPNSTVLRLGDELMTRYVLPLEVLGLLLTAALIGAVILAMQDPAAPEKTKPQ